jgi:hypothetical protein
MDRSVLQSFAQSYPSYPNNTTQKQQVSIPPKAMTPNSSRTPIEQIPAMYTPSPTIWEKEVSGAIGYNAGPYTNEFYASTKQKTTQKDSGYKKLFLVLLIALFGTLIFSSYAYSITDHLASGLGMDLFGKDGEPSIIATITHALLFVLIIYLILIPFKETI